MPINSYGWIRRSWLPRAMSQRLISGVLVIAISVMLYTAMLRCAWRAYARCFPLQHFRAVTGDIFDDIDAPRLLEAFRSIILMHLFLLRNVIFAPWYRFIWLAVSILSLDLFAGCWCHFYFCALKMSPRLRTLHQGLYLSLIRSSVSFLLLLFIYGFMPIYTLIFSITLSAN